MFEPLAELPQSEPDPVQRKNRIDRQLPRRVNQAAAATIQPAHVEPAGRQLARLCEDVGTAAFSTDRDQRRMLAQQNDALRVIPVGNFEMQVFLQQQRGFEVDHPEQIDLQRTRPGRSRLRMVDCVPHGVS